MERRWVAVDFGGLDVFREVEVDVPPPGPGEVTIEVKAIGMNPADYKYVSRPGDPSQLPLPVGYEVAGLIRALGPDTEIASGGGSVGDEVLAFRVAGGYATALTVPAKDVFAKPSALSFPEAANLFLAGTTAAEALHVVGAAAGETILVHGASGAVGVSVLQQARELGVRVIGTASEENFDTVREFGGIPLLYGTDLEQRVLDAAPDGIAAAIDTVGTDEAVDVSLALVANRARIVTIAAAARAEKEGFLAIGGMMPASAAFRAEVRPRLLELAAVGKLVVPVAQTFAFDDALDALRLLGSQHPGGKLALVP
jgi:NADPH:quinone reductase-like Zn-dependent oxidoreductase